jgi:hypothetical protein
MARFMTTRAVHFGSTRVRAGKTIADSQQPGDVVWTGLTSATLPQGFNPLDASATTMKSQSKWGTALADTTITGADSIDA